MADVTTEYRYNRLTWQEMNEAIGLQKVVILPTGSTEQHGSHLPLDTDVFLAESVCLEAARRAWPIGERQDQHTRPVQNTIQW
jgi:creatinine amidohydrolase